VSTGGFFTCARFDTGAVKCWGTNNLGELGSGDTTSRGRSPTDMGAALPSVRLY
jgi:alpha-tubulin suppressor-like RCC1 family protein